MLRYRKMAKQSPVVFIAPLIACLCFFLVTFGQSVTTGTILKNANLRTGPGATYPIAGTVKAGQVVVITEKNPAGAWYHLDKGQWIAAFLVKLNPAAPPPQGQLAQVTNIVDGDTIDVSMNGKVYRLRYILIDTPERGRPYFQESTEANRALVAGKTVYLVKDVSETDKYGRLLRYVYLADGTLVNQELVWLGYALIATFPPDIAKETEIRAAQTEAQQAKRGLWASQSATPTALPSKVAPPTQPAPTAMPAPTKPAAHCDPAYPDVCIPPAPPDLDCGEIPYRRFKVLAPDPHRFDADHDGIGCESG